MIHLSRFLRSLLKKFFLIEPILFQIKRLFLLLLKSSIGDFTDFFFFCLLFFNFFQLLLSLFFFSFFLFLILIPNSIAFLILFVKHIWVFLLFLRKIGLHHIDFIGMWVWLCSRSSLLLWRSAVSCGLFFSHVLIHWCFQRPLTCLAFDSFSSNIKKIDILIILDRVQQFVQVLGKSCRILCVLLCLLNDFYWLFLLMLNLVG